MAVALAIAVAKVALRAVEAVTVTLVLEVASRAVAATVVLAVEVTWRTLEAVTIALAVEVASHAVVDNEFRAVVAAAAVVDARVAVAAAAL